MEEAQRLLNPWVLHLQKLGLELKCPLCLQLFNRPMLLPCNHIFCSLCMPKTVELGSECPACKHQYVDREVKPAPFIENIVNIYRNIDATFNANIFHTVRSDVTRVSAQSPASINIDVNINSENQNIEIVQSGNSSNGQSTRQVAADKHMETVRHSPKRPIENDANGSNLESNTSQTVEVKRQKKTNDELNNTSVLDLKRSPCAFCHSSEESEGRGPLVSYANGKEVDGNVGNFAKVTHVHEKCTQWAPQIYFKDGKIHGLESELARASKLKCHSCGEKGAVLGCYMKSCKKTFHVPCAYDIYECRWDEVNFLMLCPSHTHIRFPGEKKSKAVKQETEKKITTNLNPCTTQLNAKQDLVLCGSALSPEEKSTLIEFTRSNGAIVSRLWRPNVTHVIAAIDSNSACTRTLKVLMGILNGKWIVTVEWIKACVKAGCLVNEEPYEVHLDTHGCSGGPKAGRLRVLNNGPKLFINLKFYFVGEFVQAFKADLLNLVTTGGGTIIEDKNQLLSIKNEIEEDVKWVSLVVYNADVFGEEDSVKVQKLNVAEEIARESRAQIVGHTWILESIAGCKLLPFTSTTHSNFV